MSTKKPHSHPGLADADKRSRWLTLGIILAVIATFCTWFDRTIEKRYIFQPAELHALVKTVVDRHPNDTRAMVNTIVSTLAQTHGTRHINMRILKPVRDGLHPAQSDWFFNNAGGAMGAVYVIHASFTEYLMIFGTPLGTEGHTGRYLVEDYFHILSGEQWAFSAGSLEKEVYKPGSMHLLPRGQVQQYKMHEGCWALEYARGWIPLMLPFGVADSVFSTLEPIAIYHTFRISAREMLWNLLFGKI
ncbi:ERG2 and sigma1 receptor-like protein [Auricularia subglabra TFB-10046 SS5]|nr:ERG2 and sigma1 receptor-like protein [Auricularia subglabra TFB-10046 SS5]